MTGPRPMKAVEDGRRNEDERLWKRVRTLESSLGYSNLAFEGCPNGLPAEGATNPLLQAEHFEPLRQHRKRRLPIVGLPSRVLGSALQAEFVNSRSVPALSPPPEEQSLLPWTQPANSSRTAMMHQNLPRLPGLSHEAESSLDPEASGGIDEIATLGGRMLPEPCEDPAYSREECEGGQLLKGQDPGEVLSPRHLRDLRRSERCISGQVLTLPGPESSDAGRVDSNAGACALRCAGLPAADAASTNFGAVSETMGNESRRLVAKSIPSRQKLRTVRAGRCRSLVSPNNPFTSNKVVARVKQGLKNGTDEKRPKVLIVGSGTFNPVHKIHIRRFYLARKFLETHKGVSVLGSFLSARLKYRTAVSCPC